MALDLQAELAQLDDMTHYRLQGLHEHYCRRAQEGPLPDDDAVMHLAVQRALVQRGYHPAYHGSCQPAGADDVRSLNEATTGHARRVNERFCGVEQRLDANRTLVDQLRQSVSSDIKRASDSLRSLVWRTVAMGVLVTAVLCLVTLVVLV